MDRFHVMLSAGRALRHEASLALFPRGCAGCGAPDETLCPDCARLFAQCARRPGAGYASPLILSCAWYRGAARRTILAWKDHGDTELDAPLAAAAARLARQAAPRWPSPCPPAPILVVPAPSSRTSTYARGRIHLLPIARGVARGLQACGIDAHCEKALSMRGVTDKSVARGDARSRAARLEGRIRASEAVRGRTVVVIDDIMTTGATLTQCARALDQAGATPLAALTLAAVPPRPEPQA